MRDRHGVSVPDATRDARPGPDATASPERGRSASRRSPRRCPPRALRAALRARSQPGPRAHRPRRRRLRAQRRCRGVHPRQRHRLRRRRVSPVDARGQWSDRPRARACRAAVARTRRRRKRPARPQRRTTRAPTVSLRSTRPIIWRATPTRPCPAPPRTAERDRCGGACAAARTDRRRRYDEGSDRAPRRRALYGRAPDGTPLPPSLEDIAQGGLNDCFLMGALAAIVSADPNRIKTMIAFGPTTPTPSFSKA